MNLYCFLIAIAGSLGGLLAGYDMGVISGALLFIKKTWALTPAAQGFLVSSAIIGCFLGAFLNGWLSDLLGRKKIIIATALIFFAGSILSAVSLDIRFLIFSRIIVGIAVGMASFVVPLYLSEISPKKYRGAFVSMFQLALTFGILFAYFVNAAFADSLYNWRLMLFVGIVPSLILFFTMLFLKDSPRWLVLNGKKEEALEVIKHLGTGEEIGTEREEKNDFVFRKWMAKPLLLGIGIMFAQICTGINTIIYYAPTIFQFAGFNSEISAITATIGVGIVNFIMTFVAIFLSDRIGRKPLVFAGLSIMFVSMSTLALAFNFSSQLGNSLKIITIISAMAYICAFSFSLGPVTYILISEIFPLKIRGFLMSISLCANFIFNFIVVLLFLPLINTIGQSATFLMFSLICIISIIFYYVFIPETKGVSLEEIERSFKKE